MSEPRRTETVDRYLETIYYILHEGEVARPGRLAEWLGVRAPTVTVSLQRLERDGWVRIAADRSVELTDTGASAASDIVRRHRIVERWMTDVLGLDWATADKEAADLAHGMSPLVLERLDALLGEPSTCPHGNVIPGRRPPKGRPLRSLAGIAAGATAPIARISEVAEHDAPLLLGMLDRHGLHPGTDITVVKTGDGHITISTGSTEVELTEAVAHAIWVQEPL